MWNDWLVKHITIQNMRTNVFFQWISTSSDKEKGCVNNAKNLFADYEEK
jgi:hypothetical protein